MNVNIYLPSTTISLNKFTSFIYAVRRGDVLSVWSGIRPLVLDPNSKDTKSISRNHVVDVSANQLVTIAGGKWTTYRAMAKHAVDAVVKVLASSSSSSLPSLGESKTEEMLLEGADGWHPMYSTQLVQQFGIEPEVRFMYTPFIFCF